MLEATSKPVHDLSRPRLFVAAWALIGLALAASDVLSRAPQAAPLFILVSVAVWTLVYWRDADVRAWLDALPLRPLIACHAIRLPIGMAFLWDAARGRLPMVFAERAGIGDMAIGVVAIVIVASASWWRRHGVVLAFSVLGLVDILVALGTGMYLLFVADDLLMHTAIARLPYSLLPFLIVPTVILMHLLVLARLRRSA